MTFKRISGNSSFANGELQQTVVSDNLGLAGVTLIASNVYGDTTIILAKPDSAASNAVQDTFMVVTASPDSMRIVSGDQQTAVIATTLPQPLVVQLWDNAGAPLQDYPVLFKILGSGGKLAGGSDSVAISTDSSGVAQTSWTLGAVAGLQQVVAEAQFNEKALRQSPLLFTATAVTGGVSAVLSQVVLASEPFVLADSQAAAIINIYLKDDFGNVIADKPVEIEVSGQNNFIKQPDSLTNHQGLATAELRSTVAERKVIKARVVSDSLVLQDSVIVRFIASGNQQNGMVNRVLPQPLAVRARDKFGNFAGASRVVFTVLAGEGSIVGNHILTSDSNGVAQAQWQLGPQPGLNRLSASLEDSPHVAVTFSANAIDSTTTGVADDTGTLPQQFALHQNSPNPFNPETMMQFSLPEAAQVELSIYDLTGRRIKILLATQLPAGAHRVRWNGKDEAGQSLHSGVYFYTLRARMLHSGKTMTATRKLALIK
ncbi:Ig-like domain-containing protein [candidate division KSB1 bacterium]|nr:Ig-like domain-containing protein [candidate division KSB1 bacterium]